MLPFTIEELEAQIAEGNVTKRPHPDLPLYIYNYSPEVQFRKYWNNVTMNCRGLILDHDYNIVARPWKKFFNLGKVELPIQFDTPVEIMDKADGSLGILYPAGDGWAISTRGSFASEQAYHATRVYNEKYGDLSPMPGYTLLFEIIYPQNRIVLNYGKMDDLVLLGAVENETGYYHGPKAARYLFMWNGPFGSDYGSWRGPIVETFDYNTLSGALGYMSRKNAEGYVVRSHNFLVKMKQADYLELHRLVTNLTPRTVWVELSKGRTTEQICSAFPDEFADQAREFADELTTKHTARVQQIERDFVYLIRNMQGASRKEFALKFANQRDKSYFFVLLDKNPIDVLVWKELKPRASERDTDE